MPQSPAGPDEEITDFDDALGLIGELEGRPVAIGLLVPRGSARMSAVVRGKLQTSPASKPSTDSRVVRTAFFGLQGGPPNMGHWGPQGFYVSEPVFESAKRTVGGVILVLHDTLSVASRSPRRLRGESPLLRPDLRRRRRGGNGVRGDDRLDRAPDRRHFGGSWQSGAVPVEVRV